MITSERHHLTAKEWLECVAVLAGIDAAIWLMAPEFVTSSAYDFARSVMPQTGWGLVYLAAWIAASVGLIDRFPAKVRDTATVVAFVIYGMAASTIGLSIAVLTLAGSEAALTGASKWWLPAVVCARLMAKTTPKSPPVDHR